jgi:predicted AAA+ superfamily ATPase
MSTIAADTADDLTKQIRADTSADYLAVLQRVMVIEELPSWGPHLRSRDILRQGPVRHFVDPSLAVA